MTAADDANQRLEAAISRLETTLQARLGDQNGAADAERGKLEQEMAAVRSEFAALKETSAAVSQHIDGAISTIKGILAK